MKLIIILFTVATLPSLLKAQYFDLREGNNKYLAGDYEGAKRQYDKIITSEEKFENKKEAIFNSGNALYRLKKFDDAETDYRKIAENTSLSPSLRAHAFYNIGNSYFMRAKDAQADRKESLLKDAIKHYKESLKLDPNDLQAKQNLELAKALLKQEEDRKQGQRPNNQQDQSQNNNNNTSSQEHQQNDKNQQDQKNNNDQQDNKQNKQNQNPQDKQHNPNQQQSDEQQGKHDSTPISKADAEKLLDALKQDEKEMLKKYLMRKSNQTKYDKDW